MLKEARRLLLRARQASSRRALLALGMLTGALALGLGVVPAHATPPDVITAAEYAEPVTRYGHNVFGDAAEWGALKLTVEKCYGCETRKTETITIRLPETRVFEDTAPRLIDLDDDSIPEVVVIESDLSQGARLAVYDEAGLITATPFIGQTYRWLAPLGAADLDGDGVVELAYVDRPHLAKILRIWRYSDRTLSFVTELPGLTNHRIGETTITGGIRDCGTGPEIVTVDATWQQVMVTRLSAGQLTTQPLGRFSSAAVSNALNCG